MKKLLSLTVIALFSLMATAQVSQTINVTTAGTLSTLASAYLSTVTNITVTGNIDARDVLTMRDQMPNLAILDISGVSIVAYTGTAGTGGTTLISYSANEMPIFSFYNTFVGGKISQKIITLPTTLISIEYGAFMGCRGLTGSLTIPNSVTTLGRDAFNGCSNISSLTLGNSVIIIGDHAFYNCSGLKLIYCLNETPPTLGSYAFIGDVSVTNVLVPTIASVIVYKAAISYFQRNKINI